MEKIRSIVDNYRNKNENGFTIIEMAVAIVIIGVLSLISVATYNGFRKDAIHATLIEDVWHAGTKLQGIIILSDDPGIVPENVDFFVSDDDSVLTIKVLQNPRGSYCVIGTNSSYEELVIYYSSSSGGITKNPADCGIVEDTPINTPTQEPTVEPTQTPTQEPTVESTQTPTQEPTVTPSPTQEPTVSPSPSSESTVSSSGYPEMSANIPQSAKTIIALEMPSDTCKALIEEKIKAKTHMYDQIKYHNLTSIMARLQSGNATIESIMANTPSGTRYKNAINAIQTNKDCSGYMTRKDTVARYYERAYNEEQQAYIEFLQNLNEHSAVTYAYNQSYIKLYNRVYGTTA